MTREVEELTKMRDTLLKNKWVQGVLWSTGEEVEVGDGEGNKEKLLVQAADKATTNGMCLLGAYLYNSLSDGDHILTTDPVLLSITKRMCEVIEESEPSHFAHLAQLDNADKCAWWNDSEGRTKDEVIEMIDLTIASFEADAC